MEENDRLEQLSVLDVFYQFMASGTAELGNEEASGVIAVRFPDRSPWT